MQRFGFALASLGVSAWVVTGAVFYLGHGGTTAIARGPAGYGEVATVASLYSDDVLPKEDPSAHAGEAWDEQYSLDMPQEPSETVVVRSEPRTSWFSSAFRGIGSFFGGWFGVATVPIGMVTTETNEEPAQAREPSCIITVNPNSVPYGGTAIITWVSRNADHIVLQGYGEVAQAGTITVSDLAAGRAFALAVGGEGGASSCYTVVQVESQLVKPLTCMISAHPAQVEAGEAASISWSAQGAISATLSDGRQVPTIGGITATPKETTTYTLTIESLTGKSATCDTTVEVQ